MIPDLENDFDLLLFDDGIEMCDHGVAFDQPCEDCETEDWLLS